MPPILRLRLLSSSSRSARCHFHTLLHTRPRTGINMSHRTIPQHNHHLQLEGPGRILWSYFTAPSNLVFVSTNLLALTILGTWRGLHTASRRNTGIEDDGIITLGQEEEELMGMDQFTRTRGVLNFKKRSIIDELDTDVFEGQEFDLPMTEEDLDAYGPTKGRDVKTERIQNMIVDELLYLYNAQEELSTMFEKGIKLDSLHELNQSQKEAALRSLMATIDTQEQEITSLEEFIDRVPSDEIHQLIATISSKAVLHSMHSSTTSKPITSYEEREATPRTYSRHAPSNQLPSLLREYKDITSPSPSFLVSSASAILNTNLNLSPISSLFPQLLNTPTPNENFHILSNIISNTLMQTNNVHSEHDLDWIMKSAIAYSNRPLFTTCLTKLRLTDTPTDPRLLINRMSFGNDSLSLSTYTNLLDGAIRLEYDETTVMKAVNKTISGLFIDERGQVRVKIQGLIPRMSYRVRKAWESADTDFVSTVLKIGVKFENKGVVKWCVDALMLRVQQGLIEKSIVIDAVKALESRGLYEEA